MDRRPAKERTWCFVRWCTAFLASGAGSHASPRRPYGRTPAIGRMDLPGGAALERSDPTRCVSGQTSSARRCGLLSAGRRYSGWPMTAAQQFTAEVATGEHRQEKKHHCAIQIAVESV